MREQLSLGYDVSELTVNAAHRVVCEALAGMAARRRDAAATRPGPPSTLIDRPLGPRPAPPS